MYMTTLPIMLYYKPNLYRENNVRFVHVSYIYYFVTAEKFTILMEISMHKFKLNLPI